MLIAFSVAPSGTGSADGSVHDAVAAALLEAELAASVVAHAIAVVADLAHRGVDGAVAAEVDHHPHAADAPRGRARAFVALLARADHSVAAAGRGPRIGAVRRVVRRVGLDGTVSTYAGAGAAGFAHGALPSAKLNKPQGRAGAGNGGLYGPAARNFRGPRITRGRVGTHAGTRPGGAGRKVGT